MLLLLGDALPVVLKGGTEVVKYVVPIIAKNATQYFVSNRTNKVDKTSKHLEITQKPMR